MRSSKVLKLTGPVLLLTAYCLFPAVSFSQVAQLGWDVQQDRPVPHEVILWQGETVDLLPRLVQGIRPVAITNAPVEFRYREASLPTNTYRYVAASANTNNGVIAVRWRPDYDAGAPWYDYQVIVGSNAANPRCFGRIVMRQTIGWHASTNPPPPVTLYPTRTEFQALSNTLAAAVQMFGTNVDAQLSSITGALATASALIESNRVALAEIPPPSSDALRLISTNGTEWIDGEKRVWRITFVAVTNVVCTLSSPFGRMPAPDFYDAPSQPSYVSPPGVQIQDGDWTINFDVDNNGTWQVANFFYPSVWAASGSELPLVAEGDSGECFGTATFSWLVTYAAITTRVDTVALLSDMPGTNGLITQADADARYLSETPGWFWQGSQQVATNVCSTNLSGVAVWTNFTQLAILPYTPSRHDVTGTVEFISCRPVIGLAYSVVLPNTGIEAKTPVYYDDERTSQTSWVVRAWCSDSAADIFNQYFAFLTNVVVYSYDRADMATGAFTNDSAGIISRVDTADVEPGSRLIANGDAVAAYIESRKDEIAKRAFDFTPGGARTPNAAIFTLDEPLVQQGAIAYMHSGDYFCQSYIGGDWYSTTTGSVWRIGPSGRVAFEIASTNRMLRIQAFSVSAGVATLDISTNWVTGTPSIEFCDDLLLPQWVACPAQTIEWRTNYWRGVCPGVATQRFFRAVDPSGDNVLRSYHRHEFKNGITIGEHTFKSLAELKELLNAIP